MEITSFHLFLEREIRWCILHCLKYSSDKSNITCLNSCGFNPMLSSAKGLNTFAKLNAPALSDILIPQRVTSISLQMHCFILKLTHCMFSLLLFSSILVTIFISCHFILCFSFSAAARNWILKKIVFPFYFLWQVVEQSKLRFGLMLIFYFFWGACLWLLSLFREYVE